MDTQPNADILARLDIVSGQLNTAIGMTFDPDAKNAQREVLIAAARLLDAAINDLL